MACADESIDEIAAFLGVGDQVAALTAKAMGGSVKFQDALAERLNLMACSQQQLDAFLAAHPAQLSPGIPELVTKLQQQGKADDGSYSGFDAEEFTSRSGGKAEAVRDIKSKYSYKRIVMVGDGATDMEARQPDAANIFIGYGGVVERPNIAAQADWYIYDIQTLLQALLEPA
ncbi:HAD-like domain-containing protein [Scenedesmus sp. NREL 46B-D3]|nr:HAD-like domain-containing protein [Scenedesmus sp. NREL 46B-D3]